MRVKLITIFILLFAVNIVFAGSAIQQNTEQEVPVSLQALINEVLKNNPQLQAKDFNLKAARKRISQAEAWGDPKLTLGIMSLPVSDIDFSLEPMTSKQVGLMQRIPFPGILSLKRDIAEKNAAIANYSVEDYRKILIRDISKAYFDLYIVEKSISDTGRLIIPKVSFGSPQASA